jgi:hypothetical protein
MKRRWITFSKWAKMPPLKGGPNGSKEVIHAKNSRGPQAEGLGVELSGDRPGVSHRQTDGAGVLGRAAEAGLTWPLPEGLSEEELERRLFPHEPVSYRKEAELDWAYVSREPRKQGVTRELLWEEYRVGTPQGYHYSQFCQRYRWLKKVLTTALLDRLLHHAKVLTLDGESYRIKKSRKEV